MAHYLIYRLIFMNLVLRTKVKKQYNKNISNPLIASFKAFLKRFRTYFLYYLQSKLKNIRNSIKKFQ